MVTTTMQLRRLRHTQGVKVSISKEHGRARWTGLLAGLIALPLGVAAYFVSLVFIYMYLIDIYEGMSWEWFVGVGVFWAGVVLAVSRHFYKRHLYQPKRRL